MDASASTEVVGGSFACVRARDEDHSVGRVHSAVPSYPARLASTRTARARARHGVKTAAR